ncbi:Response regulator PleD [Fundidesulfovibrio magnetotacticus]|uniref:diguanylate cyclase n=1 Tax=Fundidesulfovibrio magnetotacticus TaxID=2730080 RepID=A0A6V8LVA0_9BACT|nr:diguanylate cyclase [Fundidesulfovibrio magnetotacticus]GFK93597.1 Response regulator PleD [Fundidesulfovibrio magnetotacticus]
MTGLSLHSLKVLIVEDDAPSRVALTLVLENRVARIFQADNGQCGLDIWREHAPHVIVTDLRMPCLDGLGMIREIRGNGGDPFVIVASAFGAEESYLDAIELGVNLFIKKPYNAEDIFAGLERAARTLSKRGRDAYRQAMAGGLLSHVPNCHLLTDGERIFYFNDPQAILPRSAQEGQDLGAWLRANFTLALRHGMAQSSLPQGIGAWLERHTGREFILAGIGQERGGKPARFLLRLDRVRMDGGDLHLLTFTDISRIEHERVRFFQLAGRDHLTGVGNRQAFEAELAKEIGRAKRYGSELCLLMLDIDDFKAVNDNFGHQTGDTVLVALARTVCAGVRVTDVVCRYGGEEFMVIMPQTTLQGAFTCGRKLAKTLACQDFGVGRPVTASLGVAQFNPSESAEALVRRVDMALYEAKKAGKNRVTVAGDAACTLQDS